MRRLVALGGLVKVLPSGRRVGRMVKREAAQGGANRLSIWQFKINEKTGCWNWLRSISNGYGYLWFFGRHRAHRAMFSFLRDSIPVGLTLDHLCRNKICVNPNHLEAVTLTVNILRGNSISAVNSRKTHCKKGHPFKGSNLYLLRGTRECRICKNRRWNVWKRAQEALHPKGTK